MKGGSRTLNLIVNIGTVTCNVVRLISVIDAIADLCLVLLAVDQESIAGVCDGAIV